MLLFLCILVLFRHGAIPRIFRPVRPIVLIIGVFIILLLVGVLKLMVIFSERGKTVTNVILTFLILTFLFREARFCRT